MKFPSELFYTKDHEWARIDANNIVTIGITDHAQESLGEVVYVELPKIGRELKAHEAFGVVESIKAVSDLYSPVTGTVVELNDSVTSNPSSINHSPYDDGWLMRVRINAPDATQGLLKVDDYRKLVASLK